MRCAEARAALQRHMLEHGLLEKDGWAIYEFVRESDGRTELVMRPIHRELPAPSDFECMCSIDEQGSETKSECSE